MWVENEYMHVRGECIYCMWECICMDVTWEWIYVYEKDRIVYLCGPLKGICRINNTILRINSCPVRVQCTKFLFHAPTCANKFVFGCPIAFSSVVVVVYREWTLHLNHCRVDQKTCNMMICQQNRISTVSLSHCQTSTMPFGHTGESPAHSQLTFKTKELRSLSCWLQLSI